MKLTSTLAAAMLASLAFTTSTIHASTFTWTSTATGTLDWATAGNWSASTQYVSGSSNELMFFSDTTTNIAVDTRSITTNVPATLSMNTLTLNGKGASSGASSTLTIGSSASTWTIGDGTTSTVNLNAKFGAASAQGFNTTVAANLTLNQAVNTFTGSGTGGFTFSGVIGETASGYGITKSGTSTLTLTATNLFSGGLILNGGTVSCGTALVDSLGAVNGVVTVSSASGVSLTGANFAATTLAKSFVLNANLALSGSTGVTITGAVSGTGNITPIASGNVTARMVTLASTSNTFTGAINSVAAGNNSGVTVNSLADATVTPGSGNISIGNGGSTGLFAWGSGATSSLTLDNRQIVMSGTTGTAFVSNANATAANSITIDTNLGVSAAGAKTLQLGGANTGANLFAGIIADSVSPSAVISVTKADAGTWILSGSNTFTGGLTLNGGTLTTGTTAAPGDALGPVGGVVTVQSASTLAVAGGGFTTTTLNKSFVLNANITFFAGGSTGNGANITGAVSGAGNIVSGGPGNIDRHPLIFASLNNTFTGAILASQNGNYTFNSLEDATVTPGAGNINLGNNGGPGQITWGSGAVSALTLNNRQINMSGSVAGAGATINNANATAANIITINSDLSVTGAGAKTLTLGGANTGANLFAGVIADGTAGGGAAISVTKANAGQWILSGLNTYTGTTTVSGGVLLLNSADALPGGIGTTGGTGALTFNGGVLGLGSGDFTRSPLAVGSSEVGKYYFQSTGGWAAYGADRNVNLGGAGATVGFGSSSFPIAFNGAKLILGAATATHKVTLVNGVDFYTSPNRPIQVDDGAALVDAELSGVLIGSTNGGFTKSGTGTLKVSNTGNSYPGPTTISAGTLVLGTNDVLPNTPTSTVSIDNATLDASTFTDTAGTLKVTAAATINLGIGGALAFADSSAEDWTGGTLNIVIGTLAPTSIRFGNSPLGLTSGQLSQIKVNGSGTYTLDANGYLTAASGYSSWQAANTTAGTINQDHDTDGVSNGVEFFLGGATNTTGFTPLPPVVNTAGVLSVTWAKAGTYTGAYNTDFVVETSATLIGTWTTETVGGNVTITGNAVKYTFPAPLGSKRFARLRVTGP